MQLTGYLQPQDIFLMFSVKFIRLPVGLLLKPDQSLREPKALEALKIASRGVTVKLRWPVTAVASSVTFRRGF